MGLITNEMKLIQIESQLCKSISGCLLISDLNLAREEFEILGEKFKESCEIINDYSLFSELIKKYKVSFSVFLVYWALYNYSGEFWGTVESYLGIKNLRSLSGDTFLSVIKRYEMKQFDDGGYKYVTPIVCHAGIPNHSMADLFEVIYETIGEQSFSPQYMVDELRYFLKYRIDRTVYRFITYNSEKAQELFQNIRDLIVAVENDSYDLNSCFTNLSYIDRRIIDSYFKWKSDKVNYNKAAKKRKYMLVSPKIKIDAGGIGLYMLFPKQVLKTGNDDSLQWTIEYEDGSKKDSFSTDLYYNNGNMVSEEKTFRIKLASKYIISLVFEDEKISSWTYEGICNNKPYMIFDNRDNLMKTDYINSEAITFIYSSKYKLNGDFISAVEMPVLPGESSSFKVMFLNFNSSSKGISLENLANSTKINIDYKRTNLIILSDGKYLFDEEPEIEDIPTYSGELPRLLIEFTNDIVKENIIMEYKIIVKHKDLGWWHEYLIKDMNWNIKNQNMYINFSKIIESNQYGEYEVRILEGRNLKKIFAFRFLPSIDYINDNRGQWPSENRGYGRTYFMYRCNESVSLEFYDTINSAKVTYRGKEYIKLFTDSIDKNVTGKITLTLGELTVKYPIKKTIRQLQWSWWNGEQNNITWERSPKVFYLNKITEEENQQLIIRPNLNGQDFLDAYITLCNDKNQLLQRKDMRIYNRKSLRVNLEEFIGTIISKDANKYILNLKLYDSRGIQLTEFTIGVLKEKTYIKNINYSLGQDDIVSISWEQEGSLDDKVVKIYNYTKPWNEGNEIYIDLERIVEVKNRLNTKIDKNELGLTEAGIYIIKVEDDSFGLFEEEIFKSIKLEEGNFIDFNSTQLNNQLNNTKINIVDFISLLLQGISLQVLKQLYKALKKVEFKIDKQSTKKIIIGLITLRKGREFLKGEVGEEGIKYIQAIESKIIKNSFVSQNKYLFLRELIRLNLFEKDCKYFMDYFNLYDLPVFKEGRLFNTEREYLWDKYEYIGFIAEMRNIKDHKELNLNSICSYITEESLSNIFHYKHKKGCENKNIEKCLNCIISKESLCDINFRCSEELIGSVEEYQKIFNNQTRLSRGSKIDFVDWFKNYEDNGIKLLGKSYVKTIYDWHESCNVSYKEKLKKAMEILGEKIIYNYNQYRNNPIVREMDHYLSKRKDTNILNKSFYFTGLIILLKAMNDYEMIRLDFIEDINEFYHILYKCNKELFVRDSIITELYLLKFRNEV